MKDRIRQIMENEHLTPSAFADQLQLGRAVISHILNGRNNPSLDVVSRILAKMNYISSEWLITGKGEMYKFESGKNSPTNQVQQTSISQPPTSNQNQPDLFSQSSVNPTIRPVETEYRKEIEVKEPENDIEITDNKQIIYQKLPERKITKIIIYYSDNTFETFNADHSPL
ncbi:MAG: helix-turn-helix domain-containing protein [Dysgonomonas sp.]|nr:helix-turn-helix domain-containing protein [Dysgonomonas sp.]